MKNTTDLSSSELKYYLEFNENVPLKELDVKGKQPIFHRPVYSKDQGGRTYRNGIKVFTVGYGIRVI